MVKLAYIVGAGRSGSTILGIALGQLPGAFFAGELDAWWRRGGQPNSDRAEVRTFWQGIREALCLSPEGPDETYHRLFENPGGLIRRLRLRRAGLDELRLAYQAANRELFLAVAAATGARTVVDSSHYPLRLSELTSLDGVEVYAIHLVRDPRSVVASMVGGLQRRQSTVRAVAYNWGVAMMSATVLRRLPPGRTMRVRYEDFARDPAGVVARLAEWLELDPSEFNPIRMRPGPVFQGNRMRTQDVVAVDAHAQAAAARPGILAAVLLSPLRRLHGYV